MAETVGVIVEEGIRYSSLTSNENTKTREQLAETEITVKNCRLGFSSMTQKQPKNGHSVQIILSGSPEDLTVSNLVREHANIPADATFTDADKAIRKTMADKLAKTDRSVEFVIGSLVPVTQDGILKGYFKNNELGLDTLNIQLSNKKYLDEHYEVQKDGTFKGKYLNDLKDAKSDVVKILYKCTNDQSTGEPIKPEVFKIDSDGNKITTFINPKTKEEQNIYISSGDIVTAVLRPYLMKRSTDNKYVMKYNLLSLEITESSYKCSSSSGSKTSSQVAQGVSSDILSDVFGITETVVSSKKVDAPATKAVKEEVVSSPVPKQEKVKTVAATVDISDIDLSGLDDLDSMMNMGE